MKYYIGRIEEINRGMEYISEFLFCLEEDQTPEDYMDERAKNWRGYLGNDWNEREQAYECDGSWIRVDSFEEVPERDFEIMEKYLPVI